MGKLWGKIGVVLHYWFCGNHKEILKMFIWNFSEIVKKIWKNAGNILYKFFNILMEILWNVFVNFWRNSWIIIGKIWKILYGFCSFQECSYHSVHHDGANFPTSNQPMFQFLQECEGSRVRLYSHKEKSIGSKTITTIINDRVISLSLFKILKIYHNYISHQRFSF